MKRLGVFFLALVVGWILKSGRSRRPAAPPRPEGRRVAPRAESPVAVAPPPRLEAKKPQTLEDRPTESAVAVQPAVQEATVRPPVSASWRLSPGGRRRSPERRPTYRRLTYFILALIVGGLAQWSLQDNRVLDGIIFWIVATLLFLRSAPPQFCLGGSHPDPLPEGEGALGGGLRHYRWPLVLALAALALNVITLAGLDANKLPPIGWLTFLVSIGVLLWAARALDAVRPAPNPAARPPTASVSRWEWVAVGVVVVIAALLRLPGLDALPYGVWYDEGMLGLDVRALLQGQVFPFYFVGYGFGAILFYLVAGAFTLLGSSVMAMRLVVALVGVATIPLIYLLVRRLGGVYVAFAATFLLAIARWHITFSRIAFDAVLVPLIAIASLYFVDRGLRRRRAFDLAAGGALLGLGMYSYLPLRGFPLVVGVLLLYHLAANRQAWRQVVLAGVGLAVGFWVVASPMGVYALRHPSEFNARTTQASVFSNQSTAGELRQALVSNTQRHLLMFNVRGDPNGRHNIPAAPMLDSVTGVLFLLGAGYCLRHVRRRVPFLLVVLFAVMLVPGILSVDFEAPQSLRAIGVLPAVLAMAAIPLGLGLQMVVPAGRPVPGERRQIRFLRALPLLTAYAALLILAWVNYQGYFVRQAGNFAAWAAHSTGETLVARRLAALQGANADIYISSYFRDHPTIRFLTPAAPPQMTFDTSEGVPIRTQKDQVIFLLDPQHEQAYRELKQYYPRAAFEEVRMNASSPPVVLAARLSRTDVTSIQGADAAYYAGQEVAGEPVARKPVDGFLVRAEAGDPVAAPYTVELKAVLRVSRQGPHLFQLEGTAATKVFLDEYQLLDSADKRELTTTLARGNHTVRLVATVRPGEEPTSVLWQRPGEKLEPLGREFLYRPPVTASGLLGQYFPNPNWAGPPALTQVDPAVAFRFHLTPLPRPYSIEWTGKLYVPTPGPYRLGTESISASQLWVDGRQLVDNQQFNTLKEAAVELNAGYHDLRLRFLDRDGYSHVFLYWTPPGRPREPIPSAHLWPPRGSYPDKPTLPPPMPAAPPVPAAPEPPRPLAAGTASTPLADRLLVEFGGPGGDAGNFTQPRDVAVDAAGNIYVADTANFRIQKFGPDGKLLAQWGKKGEGEAEFQEPLAIAIEPQGDLLVLDSAAGWLKRFDPLGRLKGRIGGPPARLYHPRGLAVDKGGRIFIADTGGARVAVLDREGQVVESIPMPREGDSQAPEPTDVLPLDDGTFLVADAGSGGRLVRFDASRAVIGQWGFPKSVAVDGPHLSLLPGGDVVATDPERHRIVRFDPGLNLKASLGGEGSGPGLFRLPVGLFASTDGKLYVADTGNHRVQAFELPQ